MARTWSATTTVHTEGVAVKSIVALATMTKPTAGEIDRRTSCVWGACSVTTAFLKPPIEPELTQVNRFRPTRDRREPILTTAPIHNVEDTHHIGLCLLRSCVETSHLRDTSTEIQPVLDETPTDRAIRRRLVAPLDKDCVIWYRRSVVVAEELLDFADVAFAQRRDLHVYVRVRHLLNGEFSYRRVAGFLGAFEPDRITVGETERIREGTGSAVKRAGGLSSDG